MFPNKPGESGVKFTYMRDAVGRVVSVYARPVAAHCIKNKKGLGSNGDEDNEWWITTLYEIR